MCPDGAAPAALPLDRPLLRGVDLRVGEFAAAEEEGLHVVEEEGLRVLVHEVEAVVVDDHVLALEPLLPADPANLRADAPPDLVREGRVPEPLALLAAPRALDLFRHCHFSLQNSRSEVVPAG